MITVSYLFVPPVAKIIIYLLNFKIIDVFYLNEKRLREIENKNNIDIDVQ